MSAFICPKCSAMLPSEDINVATDVAFCRACQWVSKFSAVIQGAELVEKADFERPPTGVQYWQDARGMKVVATHRSLGTAVGLLAISLFWNGIVSIFVLVALAGTLSHLHVPLPSWFPAPEMNGGPMTVGMNIFLWLFLTPFITIGLGMIGTLLMTLAGRTEVQVTSEEGFIFTGIGPLGYRRRFDPATVKNVRIGDRPWGERGSSDQRKTAILIETQTGKVLKLGTMLPPDRQNFVAAAVLHAVRG